MIGIKRNHLISGGIKIDRIGVYASDSSSSANRVEETRPQAISELDPRDTKQEYDYSHTKLSSRTYRRSDSLIEKDLHVMEDQADAANSGKKVKRRKKHTSCQTCRFSRVRCENIGQFTKCSRCTKMGLKCLYSSGGNAEQDERIEYASCHESAGAKAEALEGSSSAVNKNISNIKLGACEYCKKRKVKCEESADGNSACKKCIRKNISCIRPKASRGRPMASFTRQRLLPRTVNAPLDTSSFPNILVFPRPGVDIDKYDDFLFNFGEFCANNEEFVNNNKGPIAYILSTIALGFAKPSDQYDEIKGFADNVLKISLDEVDRKSSPSSVSSNKVSANSSDNMNVNDSESSSDYFFESLSEVVESSNMPSWIVLSVKDGKISIKINSKFNELFCNNKHIDGNSVNTLSLHWKEYISPDILRNMLSDLTKHFVQAYNEHQMIQSLIKVKEKYSNGRFVYNKGIPVELFDKNKERLLCEPSIKYDIGNDGASFHVAFVLRFNVQNNPHSA
uniref:Zn(2)-C6 fungal-type domain-containing protein n=1 Tax=Aplanochytrium stocchinoi TaxID=215587 RepID=A0A7S3PNP4_9STRA|mmetsp:Transcript_492/g.579  ORF Transcript_492/g.579 Transcript_492/m.579 type:complete len:507 (-) Transcript_492:90-1610(-)|eukprot:CAMPEP_0204846860 /NCGR_PEP_ID=MMETSP1347-20130617/2308_1 /ASSEMBLY_ACC=CAM_ASM_000690 /TAXON_ID=215587 /ORGANISM="Aplanochytrium stocchinoi, Strain GSBS06" /LENGTH=506 /DNA_ID=CAMNT_0051987597 /DNA_START=109 /DNA_END=1629 /DNA_ORIENTATION=+